MARRRFAEAEVVLLEAFEAQMSHVPPAAPLESKGRGLAFVDHSVEFESRAQFGERLRSKTRTAQINEVLCKVLCHNLCCLIQSMYELGIEATFESKMSVDAEVAPV